MRRRLVVGSRRSRLALLQTESVIARIREVNPDIEVSLSKITTTGDRSRSPLDIMGTAIFVTELEQALLEGRIDIAVHSLKDVPTELPPGLCLLAVTERLDPRDALVARAKLGELNSGAKIGTGSLRRTAQLMGYRPDLRARPIRGNVDTRLGKVLSGEFDGVIVAAAAMLRLNWKDKITEFLPLEHFLPAVGQGALVVEARVDDEYTARLISALNHLPTWQGITAERAFLHALGGGCRAPVAALGVVSSNTLRLEGMVASINGQKMLRASQEGSAKSAEEIGMRLAQKMRGMGAVAIIAEARKSEKGKVYLVGAGPGDPGLMTQKGLRCLEQADVVIYDRLLDEQLLDSAPPEAERIYVGKASSEHTKEQAEINRLLIEKAKEGKRVVRLKGGDPYVLGRGAEEAEALAKKGIPFEIVPGITSAVAVPAYAGIPLTHRRLASSFAVITGHEAQGKSSINWEKLATAVDTLIFLMGMKNLPQIVSRLIEHGRSPDTPVAVIKEGTRPSQKTVVGSLKDIVTKAKEHHLTPPAVIVVGEVVGLREKLRWFDNRPLFGKRILVTRARHQAGALSRLLIERGAEPVELPAIGIEKISSRELDDAIANLSAYHWLIFTSSNGVAAFFERLYDLNLDARVLGGLKIGAIGPATAKALAQKGINADYVPKIYSSEGLIAGLKNQAVRGKRFLLPRADIADKNLANGLKELGAEVHEIAAYRTVSQPEAMAQARGRILSGQIDIIAFTSSSAVSNLVAVFSKESPAINKAKVACIGPKTAETATKAGLRVDIVAEEHTIPALVAAIEDYFRKET